MQITPGRVVAFLTPVFAAAAATLTPWLVKYTGLHITPTQVTALAITGATSASAAALKWLHGSSLYEREYAQIEHTIQHFGAPVTDAVEKADPGIVADVEGQADKVVEAAKAKLVAVLSPPADAPAPVPAIVAPVPPADPPAAA